MRSGKTKRDGSNAPYNLQTRSNAGGSSAKKVNQKEKKGKNEKTKKHEEEERKRGKREEARAGVG